MSSEASVTQWLAQLKAGDRGAAGQLWQRYFRLLVVRARVALAGAPRRAADEEDVALSAFHSFCRGVERGRFPRLDDRDDLWHILLMLTARKAGHLVRDEVRARRGGGRVRVEADLHCDRDDGGSPLARVLGTEPSPELAAQVAEEYRRLLDKLADANLRAIAVWEMEGHTVDEIARLLNRSPRTVARKLTVIRDLWREEGQT
jgi:DNA-directed RNA polymerase specialized sigma24 family protein